MQELSEIYRFNQRLLQPTVGGFEPERRTVEQPKTEPSCCCWAPFQTSFPPPLQLCESICAFYEIEISQVPFIALIRSGFLSSFSHTHNRSLPFKLFLKSPLYNRSK